MSGLCCVWFLVAALNSGFCVRLLHGFFVRLLRAASSCGFYIASSFLLLMPPLTKNAHTHVYDEKRRDRPQLDRPGLCSVHGSVSDFFLLNKKKTTVNAARRLRPTTGGGDIVTTAAPFLVHHAPSVRFSLIVSIYGPPLVVHLTSVFRLALSAKRASADAAFWVYIVALSEVQCGGMKKNNTTETCPFPLAPTGTGRWPC